MNTGSPRLMRQGHVSFNIVVSYGDLVTRAIQRTGKMCNLQEGVQSAGESFRS